MTELESMRVSMSEILSIPLNELQGDTSLAASGNWDSFAMMETVALIFEKASVTVLNEEIGSVATLQDIFDLVTRKIQKAK